MQFRIARLVVHCAATYLLWLLQFATPAHGDPVSVAILTALGYTGAGGLLAPTAVLLSLAGNAIIAAIPTILLNAAIAIGATLLASAFRPQASPAAQPNPGSRIVNLRQSVQDRTKAYGLVRLGGPVAFWKSKGGKRYVAVLANTGEITSFEGHYLDETEVTLNGSGFVQESKFQSGGNSMVQIETFLGASGQTAPTLLDANFTEWTADHKFTGIAGAVIAFQNPVPEDFGRVYPSGREPVWSGLVKGTKVYDPRDVAQTLGDETTYQYTTNAALVIADWVVSQDGLGAEVDWDEVADEADVSDLSLLDRNGNAVSKWQLCGSYSFGQDRESVRAMMAIACDAFFYDRYDGKVGFKVGRWLEPEITITDDHINSISLGEGQDGTERPNAMSVIYNEPGAGYREFQSAAYVIVDGEPHNEETFQAYWSPNHNQSVRVAKRVLLAKRSEYDVTMNLKLFGLTLRDKRTFALNSAELGLSGNFELASWRFAPDGMSIDVAAKSTSQTDWDFDAATEEPAPGEISDITVTDDIADPTNVVLSSPAAGALHVTFDPPSRPSLLKRVRYREVGAVDWNEEGVPSDQEHLTINGLPFGDTFEAQVQFRTATGNGSDWVASTPASIEISATSSPPDPVTGASATGGAGQATFNWTAPNSPNYVGARIYINTVDSFPGGTPAATEYGLPDAADSILVTELSSGAGPIPAGTYYGFIVAINSAGDEASPTSTGAFIVT